MDPFASWLTQVRKGLVELCVLELLRRRGPLHGYGIVRALDEVGDLIAGVSTVYPVLKRLENDGLVSWQWDPDAPGNPRKSYTITRDGVGFLDRARSEWEQIAGAMEVLRGEEG